MQIALIHVNVELTSNQAWQHDTNCLNSCPFLNCWNQTNSKNCKVGKRIQIHLYLSSKTTNYDTPLI
jgi:hypothetical protein